MSNHRKSNPRRRYTHDHAMTALVVWEEMLDRYLSKERPRDEDLAKLWENVGTWEMRELALGTVAPWVNSIWAYVSAEFLKIGSEEPLAELRLDAWDWEFVPACFGYITWHDGELSNIEVIDARRTAALLIAEAALSDKAV